MELRTISAMDELSAIKMAFIDKFDESHFVGCNNVEAVCCEVFNSDAMIGILDITQLCK